MELQVGGCTEVGGGQSTLDQVHPPIAVAAGVAINSRTNRYQVVLATLSLVLPLILKQRLKKRVVISTDTDGTPFIRSS